MRRPFVPLAALLLALGIVWPAPAFEPVTGEFRATAACPAFQSLRSRRNPGEVRTSPGTTYRLRGLNRPEGQWVQLEIDGAQPAQRWVERACGAIDAADPEAVPAAGLLPFFDLRDEGQGDPAPPPPSPSPLDLAVLEVCGAWGSRPTRADFRAMLDRPELAPEIEAIFAALGRGIGTRPQSLRQFKDGLARVWFDAGGFAHIFCGEPGPDAIEGLHFRGRYRQLQEAGLAGRMAAEDCPREEIDPPVYTLGVVYRLPGSNRLARDCVKGYALDLDAAAILAAATHAYAVTRASDRMCLVRLQGASGRPYLAVFVRARGGIRTFYPDASPACDGGRPPAACLCGG